MKKLFIFLVGMHLFSAVYSQEKKPLLIGDPAPEIRFSKWLKGTPVTSFAKGKMYVIECWATWCGPCIAAMPHLSELAAKYKDKVTFIGFNVWEKIPEDQPYETVLPRVTKFVENLGDKMSYNVAVDDDNRYMAKNWLARAKAPGIPTTFLVKDGKFIWIGHPKGLEAMIIQVENGTYDMAAARKGHEASIDMSKKAASEENKLVLPIDSAVAAKDYNKAFALMDKAVTEKPLLKYTMNIRRFKTLLDFVGEKQALEFSEEWKKKEGEHGSVYFAQAIVEKKGYSKETYLYAASQFEKASGGSSTVNPMYYDLIGTSYALAGDFENASVAQAKAVQMSKAALKDGKFSGIILDYTVTEYEEKLKTYQAKSMVKNK